MQKNRSAPQRCDWCLADPAYIEYHDVEWGIPVHDDKVLFEFLILEGAQAGLSWLTVLKRREGYRKAFCGFDPLKVAVMTEQDVCSLVKDAGIIRHRGKIESAITNAKAFLKVQEEFGSFAAYAWGFVENKPVINKPKSLKEVPATTLQAEAFSKDLKRRGFKFVGPTIVYAYMQAIGMVNDHLTTCFRFGSC